MGHNLRDRLQTIKSLRAEIKGKDASLDAGDSLSGVSGGSSTSVFPSAGTDRALAGWLSVTGLVKKRILLVDMPVSVPALTKAIRQSLAVLVPDLLPALHTNYTYGDFVFFDLETTGLSSGAGTLAFIAAFGRLKKAHDGYVLQIVQYLLLDYPGENDFLEAMLGEFDTPFIVSYNGKCFDSQILKTRCIMNAIVPPAFRHVDLLHPARYLWKRTLSSCSQPDIEIAIHGLDRTGDISGAFAPDIWFSFLRTGDQTLLAGICEHNKKDILGIASIFTGFIHIATDPVRCAGCYGLDRENMALRWHSILKYNGAGIEETVRSIGDTLIQNASDLGYPKASLVLASDRMKSGFFEEARQQLSAIADGVVGGSFLTAVKSLALRTLAIDAEHRLKDRNRALAYVEQALAQEDIGNLRADLEHRKERLLKKIEKTGNGRR